MAPRTPSGTHYTLNELLAMPATDQIAVPYETRRTSVRVPGLLLPTVKVRYTEFYYVAFSPFALELICFDLRARRTHTITGPFSLADGRVQEAVDRELVRCYRPGSTERNGALIQFVLGQALDAPPSRERGSVKAVSEHIRMPKIIRECVDERLAELEYESFTAYVTGLIRYDLMLGGPHKYFTGQIMKAKELRELDRKTAEIFHSKPMRPTFIDFFVERLRHKTMTPEERDAELQTVADKFLQHVAKKR